MSDPFLIYLLLCLSALAAGAVNSIAGGGTLLSFPPLLKIFNGLENGAVLANATSTVALLPGSFAGALGYRKEVIECRKLILQLLAPSLIGGALGSILVIRYPGVFAALVPWLILSAAFLFLLQGPIKRLTGAGSHGPPRGRTIAAVVLGQFLIAIYGGYFGAGIGILMLSVLPFMGTQTIHQTNAAKTVLAVAMNGVTVLIFIIEGVVVWPYALAMAAAAILGGYLGARFARRLPAIYVRVLVVIIGFGLGLYYLWKEFGNGS
ncbi:MAG TPA: sulfite exporter TauE/SafE family protein [Gemmataceae bacterium]|nr:sulfite exporter TauE/SafE family protein [Gemmataceae bacterium]